MKQRYIRLVLRIDQNPNVVLNLVGKSVRFNGEKLALTPQSSKPFLIRREHVGDDMFIEVTLAEPMVTVMFSSQATISRRGANTVIMLDKHPFVVANKVRKILSDGKVAEKETGRQWEISPWHPVLTVMTNVTIEFELKDLRLRIPFGAEIEVLSVETFAPARPVSSLSVDKKPRRNARRAPRTSRKRSA